MDLNNTISKVRVDLQNSTINKSGKNSHAGFSYFELKDFLPTLNMLMLENGLNDRYTIEDGNATLYIMKGEDSNKYSMPFTLYETPMTNNNKKMMQDIQYLGALNTYYKRYLYLNAFGITDGDVIDGMNNNDIKEQPEEPKQDDEAIQMAAIRTQAILDKNKLGPQFLIECGGNEELASKVTASTLKHFDLADWKALNLVEIPKAAFKEKFMEELKLAQDLDKAGL